MLLDFHVFLPLKYMRVCKMNKRQFFYNNVIFLVCSLMIRPLNDNICQVQIIHTGNTSLNSTHMVSKQIDVSCNFVLKVRLNFLTLNLEDPDISGFCRNDYLQVNNKSASKSLKIFIVNTALSLCYSNLIVKS